MSQFLAEDMRHISNKINDLLEVVEAEKEEKEEKKGEPLDHLLTDPVNIDDIVKKIDFNSLNRKLNLDSIEQSNLKKALEELAGNSGKVSEKSAIAIATAFKSMSGVSDITESGYNWSEASTNDIKSAILDAREKARLHPYYTADAISFIQEATAEIRKRISNKTLTSD